MSSAPEPLPNELAHSRPVASDQLVSELLESLAAELCELAVELWLQLDTQLREQPADQMQLALGAA